jgi:hypothetical protein
MPFGSGPIIRQSFLRATPLQRTLMGVAMVAGGVALVLLGRVTGGLLAVAGVVLLWRLAATRLGRSRETPSSTAPRRAP